MQSSVKTVNVISAIWVAIKDYFSGVSISKRYLKEQDTDFEFKLFSWCPFRIYHSSVNATKILTDDTWKPSILNPSFCNLFGHKESILLDTEDHGIKTEQITNVLYPFSEFRQQHAETELKALDWSILDKWKENVDVYTDRLWLRFLFGQDADLPKLIQLRVEIFELLKEFNWFLALPCIGPLIAKYKSPKERLERIHKELYEEILNNNDNTSALRRLMNAIAEKQEQDGYYCIDSKLPTECAFLSLITTKMVADVLYRHVEKKVAFDPSILPKTFCWRRKSWQFAWLELSEIPWSAGSRQCLARSIITNFINETVRLMESNDLFHNFERSTKRYLDGRSWPGLLHLSYSY